MSREIICVALRDKSFDQFQFNKMPVFDVLRESHTSLSELSASRFRKISCDSIIEYFEDHNTN